MPIQNALLLLAPVPAKGQQTCPIVRLSFNPSVPVAVGLKGIGFKEGQPFAFKSRTEILGKDPEVRLGTTEGCAGRARDVKPKGSDEEV